MTKGDTRNYNNYAEYQAEKEEEQRARRRNKIEGGLIILSAVGLGMGIFGYIRGQEFGYRRGFINGQVYANEQFHKLAGQMIDSIKESKGE